MKGIAALFAATAILFAFLAWRLAAGPVSLALLTPYLNDALDYGDAGFRAEIEDTVLAWAGWDRTLDIRAINVRIRTRDGRPVATVPQVGLNLSARSLLRGQLRATEIEIVGATVRAARRADGSFDFGIETAASAADPGAGNVLALIVSELSKPRGRGPLGLLERVRVTEADLSLRDDARGALWQVEDAALQLWRSDRGVEGELAADLDLGVQKTRIVAAAVFDPDARGIGARVAFRDLFLPLLAERLPLPGELRDIRMPLTGSVGFSVDADGRASRIDFDLTGGIGDIRVAALRPEPYALRSLMLRGRIGDRLDGAVIEEARIALGDVTLSLSGTIERAADGKFGFALDGGFDSLTPETLIRHWPPTVARDARAWIAEHIRQGRILDGVLKTRVTPEMMRTARLPSQSILLDFRFEGLEVDYFTGLPKMTEARGQARLSVNQLDLSVAEARVGPLAVSDGALLITDLDLKDQNAEINVVVRGSIRDSLELIDHKPLRLAADLGIRPAEVGGLSAVRARFVFPLEKALKLEQVEIAAAANLTQVALPRVFEGMALSDGELALKVGKTRLDAEGRGRLNGVPMAIRWSENFRARDFSSRYQLSGTLDDRARQALDIEFAPYVSGPVPVEATIDVDRRGPYRIQAKGDLRNARLAAEALKWSKPAGVPAAFEVALESNAPGAVEVESIRLTGEAMTLRGALRVENGKPNHIAIRELRYDNNLLSLAARREADGIWRIAAQGQQFDLRPFTTAVFEADGPPGDGARESDAAPVNIEARIESLILTDNHVVNDFQATMARRGDAWREVDARGRLAQSAPLHWRVWPDGNVRRTTLTSDDGGAVLSSLRVTDSVVGGSLRIEGTIRDDLPAAPVQGKAELNDFKLVRAPLLARILNIGSFAGIAQLLSGEGVSFARAEVPFAIEGASLRINEGRAWGSAMGFTGSGLVDFAGGQTNINGTIVPSYTINSALGYIPLIGRIFTSREGEGVFGATYQIAGPLADPRVSVNPLSALAPGILRRMFEPSDPQAAPPPPAEPGRGQAN